MPSLLPRYVVGDRGLEDWTRGVEAEENAVLISIPSVEEDGRHDGPRGVRGRAGVCVRMCVCVCDPVSKGF